MIDIFVPKETVSDDTYRVTRLYFASGSLIKKGDLIASLETSKADFDLEATEDGYIFYNAVEQQRIAIGELLACISDSKELPLDYFKNRVSGQAKGLVGRSNAGVDSDDARFSKKALKIIEEHKLDKASFAHLAMVTATDVEEFVRPRTVSVPDTQHLKIVVVGGGNHSKVCIDLIRQSSQFTIEGIVYTKFKPTYNALMGVPVLGGLDELPKLYARGVKLAAVGVGGLDNPDERWNLFRELKQHGFWLPNLIHRSSSIEPSVVIGEGNQVLAGAVIGSCAELGSNCIVNSNAVVSHDCVLANNVHITPGALLAGTVKVGENSIVGMGCTIYYGTTIGSNTIITNGKHIYKDIGSNQTIR